MQRARSWLLASLVVLCLLLLPAGARFASSQEATPAVPAGPYTLPYAPPPELCTFSPRDISEYQAFVGTPEATDLPSLEITAGAPADRETIDGITSTLVGVFACLNANDYLRLAGAYTDAGFVEDSGSNGLTQEIIDLIALPPQAVPEAERAVLYGIYAPQVLADGRVAAIMQRGIEGRGGVNLMILAKEGDRWLLDLWLDEPFVILPDFSFTPEAAATPTS